MRPDPRVGISRSEVTPAKAGVQEGGAAPQPRPFVYRDPGRLPGGAVCGYAVAMADDIARIAHGGKTLYGARVGILMLETRFPRIPGDMGNGLTWPFPVLYKVVPGATPDRVVRPKSAGLTNAFLDAAAELVQLGADGITTTCG